MGFTALDYGVLAAYLLATAVLGTLVGRGQRNVQDYFLGGRNLPWWAICFSIVATETSTLTFIGAPAIAFAGNLTFLQVALGYCVGKLLVTLFLIPGYFKGEIQTAYEVLQVRFGRGVRNLSALIFQVTRALSDGVRLFATALVLTVITQLTDLWTVVIIGGITIVYTVYGGMRAVVWNDVMQLLIYLGGAGLAFYEILLRLPGGWSDVVASAAADEKFRILDFTLDPAVAYTFWAGLVGGAFLTFATHGTDQMMVQRYLACGRRAASQVALLLSGIVVLFQFLLFLVIGVMLSAFYERFPMGRELERVDAVFPTFIVEQMPPGVSGLIIAAVFAAAMSTLSSSLNSLASSSLNDFYRAYWMPDAAPRHYLKVSRVLTLVWGGILIGISMLARNWGSVLEAGLTIASVTMGSVLGVFLLGLFSRRVQQTGALVGMTSAMAVMLLLVGTPGIAWTWYTLTGTSVTFTVGMLVSLISRPRPRHGPR